MNVNRVIVAGRVAKTPELKSTKGGQNVTSFGLATNYTYTSKDKGKVEEVEWHNIVFWGKVAEIICKYVERGQVLFVEGRLKTREWEDKDKVKHRVTEIIGENFQFGEKARGAAAPVAKKKGAGQPTLDPADDEIPTINIDNEIREEDLPF